MDALVKNTSSGRGLRTFSRRSRRIASASSSLTASFSYRRDRAKRRHIFLKTYTLGSSESQLGGSSSVSAKLKKAAIKLKAKVLSVLSFARVRTLGSCKCKTAIAVSHPQAVEKTFWISRKMEATKHSHIEVRGAKLHVAELGTGDKVVLFLHGFPEIWYTWRHQMVAVAGAGYRAIAIDFRGYGLSDQPAEPEKAGFVYLVEDIIALLDSLSISKVFLVGKDFGSLPAYVVAMTHPERVAGVISMGIPFMLPGASAVGAELLPEGFYVSRWREPGRALADFGRLDVKTVIRNIYILFSRSEIPVAREDQEVMDIVNDSTPLPPWFTEEDLATYASLYEKSGFRFAMQVPYRAIGEEYPIADPKVTAPTLLIMGEKDFALKFPGLEDYIRGGIAKHFVPNLETIFIPEGSHFVPEQLPEQVNKLVIGFLDKQGF